MREITCPYCESDEVELFSLFGQTLLGSQYYCQSCRSVFEAVRFDEDENEGNYPENSTSLDSG